MRLKRKISVEFLVVGLFVFFTIFSSEKSSASTCRNGAVSYDSIQGAYNNANNGDTIKCRDTTFYENLSGDKGKIVTLKGGYDSGFTTNAGGKTTLKGMMTITSGKITISNFILEKGNIKYRLHGLNFSPYLKGENPNFGTVLTESQIRGRMLVIAPFTNWVRTFGSTRGLENAPRIAREFGLKVAAGAWLGTNLSANEIEIQNLIAAASAGYVDITVIGNETLLRGDLTESQLISYIRRFKEAVPGVPVGTAEVYGELLAHPGVINASDVILANIYPFWEGKNVNNAVAFVHEKYRVLSAAAAGKEVIVSETGWPSCGNTVDQAVPSLENSCAFFLNFISWARGENVKYFYFEAFDEAWKVVSEGPQGACWGIWDEDRNMKPCMLKVFEGSTVPDNWTCRDIPGGPGTPEIEFSYVPAYGSFDNLRGQVWHVVPSEHRVAVYIYVNGGWWTKPFRDAPLTSINCDGAWNCDITTGGVDERATKIFASFFRWITPLPWPEAALSRHFHVLRVLRQLAAHLSWDG